MKEAKRLLCDLDFIVVIIHVTHDYLTTSTIIPRHYFRPQNPPQSPQLQYSH